MNAPIEAIYTTGANLYAVLVSPVDGKVWNQVGQTWEVYQSGHWAQYAVALTEYTGSGYFRAAYPISAPEVLTTDLLFARNGGSPALGDTPVIVEQSQGANVGAVGNSWQAGQNMGYALGTQQLGAVSGTPSDAFTLPTDLTRVQTDAYAGRAVIMTSGVLAQQVSFITAYDGTTFTLTINGFPSGATPASGDKFVII